MQRGAAAIAATMLTLLIGACGAAAAQALSLEANPFVEQGSKLDPEVSEASFGSSVALSANGDTALIGSPDYKAHAGEEFAGAAWVYVRSGSTWTLQAKLIGSEASDDAQQGHSVALSANGDVAIIGGPEDAGKEEKYYGAAWVFKRNGASWEQVGGKLVAGGAEASTKAAQGSSVALSANGETALVGADTNTEGAKQAGAAFVFKWNGSKWVQQGGPLVGHPGTEAGLQGWSVALSGNGETALIGGPKSENETHEREAGGAWVFALHGSEWKEQEKLPQGSGARLESGEGESVALSGNGETALVGGIGYDDPIGGAWVYTRSGEKWEQQGTPLQGNDAGTLESDLEGSGAALSETGDTALVGGYGDDVYRGASWAFQRSGSSWSEQQKLEGLGGEGPTEQGYGVALSADGNTALIGAPGDHAEQGAAWIFARGAESEPEHKQESEPEAKHEPENKGSSTNTSGTGNTSTGSTAGTSSTGAGGSTAGIASSPQAVEELELGCSRQPLVLNDVLVHGTRVELEGSAAKSLDGKQVKILFDGAKQVATATVGTNNQFSTTSPLPPAKLRNGNSARYLAESGGERSLNLKLTRRLVLEPPRVSGDTVTLVGQVLPPLTKPIAPVNVEQELECGKTSLVAHVTPSSSGRFHVTVTVPAAAKAGVYRLASMVRENKRSNRGFATYSLPLPALLTG